MKAGSPATSLTIKQSKWLKLYLECGNATEAAMQVYSCKNRETASHIGWENVRKLDYQDFLEEAGITDVVLQNKIIDGLNATKTVSAISPTKGASASTTDFIDVPDFATRHKYLETALKLKKRLTAKMDTPTNNVLIQFSNLTDEQLEQYISAKIRADTASRITAREGTKTKAEPIKVR